MIGPSSLGTLCPFCAKDRLSDNLYHTLTNIYSCIRVSSVIHAHQRLCSHSHDCINATNIEMSSCLFLALSQRNVKFSSDFSDALCAQHYFNLHFICKVKKVFRVRLDWQLSNTQAVDTLSWTVCVHVTGPDNVVQPDHQITTFLNHVHRRRTEPQLV